MRTTSIILHSCWLAAALAFALMQVALIQVTLAQAPPTPTTPLAQAAPPSPDRTSTNCAPTSAAPQQGTIKPGTTTGENSEPLGDKLAKSDGVLCPPPGVDPEMHAPTPDTGATPVIPPPGSPGGDPNVKPK